MDIDGYNQVNLTSHPASDTDPIFSPDGEIATCFGFLVFFLFLASPQPLQAAASYPKVKRDSESCPSNNVANGIFP